MFIAAVVVTVLLAALMVYAAARKLTHRPDVVQTYTRVGVPEERLNLLAYLLLLGALGLLIGMLWTPLGVAAAVATIGYFAIAIGAHVRHHDLRNVATPIVMLGLAVAALGLRLAA